MKKKIVFMLINMNVGGTEKALLNLISELPRDQYDITILMLEKQGGFLNSIPSGVHVEYLKKYPRLKEVLNEPPQTIALKHFKKGEFMRGVNLISLHIISKLTKNRSLFFNYILKDVPDFKNEYDVAVAYAGPMDFISYFIIYKVKANKKIQWIHFDITKIGFNPDFAAKVYNKFDQIFIVSQEGKSKLMNRLPNLKTKVDTFINILSPKQLLEMADKGVGFEDRFNGIRILTVGRLSKEKGQDLIIPVAAKLKENGFNVRWYCIGEGSARAEFEKLIKESGVEKDFILLGAKTNPYPFMKHCDIYVQPSRHEGYCITLSEAMCFDNPIVSTNFTGANEQISHEETGLIVNVDEVEIYHAIECLLNSEQLRNVLKINLRRKKVDTTKELEKLYQI